MQQNKDWQKMEKEQEEQDKLHQILLHTASLAKTPNQFYAYAMLLFLTSTLVA